MYNTPTKKYRMEDKLRSETKVAEKQTKIQKKIEAVKSDIYKSFEKHEADRYVQIRAINIVRAALRESRT